MGYYLQCYSLAYRFFCHEKLAAEFHLQDRVSFMDLYPIFVDIIINSRDNSQLAINQGFQVESGRVHQGRITTKPILGEKYIINGESADVSGYQPDMSADIYYEVVRIIDGKFLFLNDHLERLKRSTKESGLIFPQEVSIRESLKSLLKENQFKDGNIRICLQKSPDADPDLLCYFIPWFYPEKCTYLSGVKLLSYTHERPNPGIKKWDDHFRTNVREYIRDHGVYEALLLNKQEEITEGSRSNVFFVDASNKLISPPEKDILPGITRKYVIQICKEENIEVEERLVSIKELDTLKACFISGTSPKVLPVWKIDGHQFRPDHPTVRIIMEKFEAILNDNLEPIL
jgi:branched-chain amino acid aminotransferase